MLADVTKGVIEDATSERELLEGLGVLAKPAALCTEMTVEADPQRPRFFDMCTDTRLIGGPNPDGRYLLAMIRGDRTYRVSRNRCSTAYLGFQILAEQIVPGLLTHHPMGRWSGRNVCASSRASSVP